MVGSGGSRGCTVGPIVFGHRQSWSEQSAPASLEAVRAEFPTLRIIAAHEPAGEGPRILVDVDAWRARATPLATLDDQLRAILPAEPFRIVFATKSSRSVAPVALEVVTRLQRLIDRRNAASASPSFDAILEVHRELHDLELPLVRADYDHALDTWQWILRLDPNASFALQTAALFHDVERIFSESERRIEQYAADYQAFKDEHARRGASFVHRLLRQLGIDSEVADRVRSLVSSHERPTDEEDLLLLNDADALSFFSLNSSGFIDYYGPEHTRKKVAYTLRRMRSRARARLASCRLRPEIEAFVAGDGSFREREERV